MSTTTEGGLTFSVVEDGIDGVGISSTVTEYASGDSGTTAPTDGWQTDVPALTQGTWLWTRTTVTYTDGTTHPSYSVSYTAVDGAAGTSVTVSSTEVAYAQTTSSTQPDDTAFTAGTMPTPVLGEYMWTRVTVTYSDGKSTKSYSVSRTGEDGVSVSITAKTVEYAISASGTTAPTAGWSTDVVEATDALPYLWSRTTVTYSDGNGTVAYGVSYKGKDGAAGTSVTISSSSVTYAQTSTADQPDDTAFGEDGVIPTPVNGQYMWTKTDIVYSDGTEVKNYNVSRIGADGENGTTTHFAYSTSSDGSENFSTTAFTGATYIGVYTDSSTTDSTTYTDYTWTQLKGDTGDKGTSVSSMKEQYYLSSSNTELADGSWADTPQTWTDGMYFWTRTVITLSDGTSTTTDPVCVSGGKGPTGDDGTSVSSVDVEYYQSSSSTELADGSWASTVPTWTDGKYVWSRTTVTYSDNTSKTTDPVCITGSKGASGADAEVYDMIWKVVTDSSETAVHALNLSEAEASSGWSLQLEFYLNNAAYDAAGAKLWTTDKDGNVLGVAIEPTNTSGAVVTADDLYIDGDTANIVCQMLDSDGNAVIEESIPVLQNGADGTSVTISSTSVTYAQTATSAQPDDSAFGEEGVIPTLTNGYYLWTRTAVTYSEGTVVTDYNVSRLGTDGTSGNTTHFAYATSADGSEGFSTTAFTGATYIGVYTDSSTTDSTDYTDYTWTQFKGDAGTSVTISSQSVTYQLGTSGTTAPTGTWLTSVPEATDSEPFLWTKNYIKYSDGNESTSYSVSYKGKDGTDGTDGTGISSQETEYAANDDPTTAPADGWSTTEPTLSEGQYLWYRIHQVWTDETDHYSVPALDLDYIARVMRQGITTVEGGLVLTNIVGATDAEGNVRTYLNALQGKPALATGVKDFGLDTEERQSEVNHDGSARFGALHIDNTTDREATTIWFGKSSDNVHRVEVSTEDIPTLSDMLDTSSSDIKAGAICTDTTSSATGEEYSVTLTDDTDTVSITKVGTTLNLAGSVTMKTASTGEDAGESDPSPAADLYAFVYLVYRASSTDSWTKVMPVGTYSRSSESLIDFSISYSTSYTVQNAGEYALQVRFESRIAEYVYYYATMTVTMTLYATVDLSSQATKIGPNGVQVINSATSYFQAGDTGGDYTTRTDSMCVDGGASFNGLPFKPLWAGFVSSDGALVKSSGYGVTSSNRGLCDKQNDGNFLLTFPKAPGHTNYCVFANVIDTEDGRAYFATPGKLTTSSFHIQTSGRSSSSARAFNFLVLDMSGWQS